MLIKCDMHLLPEILNHCASFCQLKIQLQCHMSPGGIFHLMSKLSNMWMTVRRIIIHFNLQATDGIGQFYARSIASLPRDHNFSAPAHGICMSHRLFTHRLCQARTWVPLTECIIYPRVTAISREIHSQISCRLSDAYQWVNHANMISGSGLSPDWLQAIAPTNAGSSLNGPVWTTSREISIKYNNFHTRKWIGKCRQQNSSHFLSAS